MESNRLVSSHNGRHRLAKAKMIAPREKGGFNMLDVKAQHDSLKLQWICRLLMERLNICIWADYVLPQFWLDVFTIWYNRRYISLNETNPSYRNRLLNSLICFSDAVHPSTRGKIRKRDFELFFFFF